MENKHMPWDLKQMQSLPLKAKIIMTKQRIRQWCEHYDGQVYLAFSGGKDSTVLKHIVDSMYDDVPAVFVNTGLEYPEIQHFVRSIKNGEYDCFNSDVEILRPEMRFDEVIKEYGYPAVSKEVSHTVYSAKHSGGSGKWRSVALQRLRGEFLDKNGNKSRYNCEKWGFLLDAPFEVSNKCCDVMKKEPSKSYSKRTGRKAMLATMATESRLRYSNWLRHGCNGFDLSEPKSTPMAFWTEQDVLHYIKEFNVPYASVYGDIVSEISTDGQIRMADVLNDYKNTQLKTTGCKRTGCIFCMYGCHLEKEPNRFQRLRETHPKQYEYCIGGGEVVDGKWQPNIEGLGLGKVLDYIGVEYK